MKNTDSPKADWLFIVKYALRDMLRSRAKLYVFASSVIMGIAALTAVNGFNEALTFQINKETKSLSGADLQLSTNQKPTEEILTFTDSVPGEKATEINFASMILAEKSGGSRLVQIRALEGDFPFYGALESRPAAAAKNFRTGRFALVDAGVMTQLELKTGDKLKIGTISFIVKGVLLKAPGQNGITAAAAPVVYIPKKYLPETGLLQKGSRINYVWYYKFDDDKKAIEIDDSLENREDIENLRSSTAEERKESLGRAFDNMSRFLNLIGFVALLLGCVGTAGAVHTYVKERLPSAAVMRCLGASGRQIFFIYLIQSFLTGLFGALVGLFAGNIFQYFLPNLLSDFLPTETLYRFSWFSAVQGLAVGTVMSLLFALVPLLKIRRVSPLRTLRADHETGSENRDPAVWITVFAVLVFIFLFLKIQLKSYELTASVTGGLVLGFLLLTGSAALLMRLVKLVLPYIKIFTLKQGLANLYRPGNRTLSLVVSVGLGTGLITFPVFLEGLLSSKISLTGGEERPNMVLFDIQSPQKDQVADLVKKYKFPVLDEVPVITCRLAGVQGKTVTEIKADSTSEISDRTLNREYRVTYRDSLISSETIVAGLPLRGVKSPEDSIFISMDEGWAKRMKLEIGDPVSFNIQGLPLKTYLRNTRKIDWQRVQTNFLVVFPTGVLEKAPQFHVLMSRAYDAKTSGLFQRDLVKSFPNVSVIDLGLILNTLDEILTKISFVIRFMAGFSMFTGFIVLIGSVRTGKFARARESVLLRTVGASRAQIIKITAAEYLILGVLSAGAGVFIAGTGGWLAARFLFETQFIFSFLPPFLIFISVIITTLVIGMMNNIDVVSKSPLEVLRSQSV